MKVQKLDHVALYMSDRDAAAAFLTSCLGLRASWTAPTVTPLSGRWQDRQTHPLRRPDGTEPSPGAIERITIRVADPASAAARLPRGANVEQHDGEYRFDGPEGLPLALVPGEGDFVDYDLDGLALHADDPEKAARGFVKMGFAPCESAATVKAGEYRLRLVPAGSASTGGGMLFHVGCLVESAEDHRRGAEERGLEVQNFVEGPNTLAVFVRGPEDVSVEYVEHKPSFSLT